MFIAIKINRQRLENIHGIDKFSYLSAQNNFEFKNLYTYYTLHYYLSKNLEYFLYKIC